MQSLSSTAAHAPAARRPESIPLGHLAPALRAVEDQLEQVFADEDPFLYGPLRALVRRGGKRIRPALVLLSCGAAGGNPERAIGAAAVVELLHNFTLVHDDIEDESPVRRGHPTLHEEHGVAFALNAGDALYTMAWREALALDPDPVRTQVIAGAMAAACRRLVDGQGRELWWRRTRSFDEPSWLAMARGKTGALLGLACELGGLFAAPMLADRLRRYGERLGLAYQIQDDLLSLTSSDDSFGKECTSDLYEGKRSLMVIHALGRAPAPVRSRLLRLLTDGSRERTRLDEVTAILTATESIAYAEHLARQMAAEATSQIAELPGVRDRDALIALTEYAITRTA